MTTTDPLAHLPQEILTAFQNAQAAVDQGIEWTGTIESISEVSTDRALEIASEFLAVFEKWAARLAEGQGVPSGYVVGGKDRHGVIEIDWDGVVYPTAEDAAASLQKCRETYEDWGLYALLRMNNPVSLGARVGEITDGIRDELDETQARGIDLGQEYLAGMKNALTQVDERTGRQPKAVPTIPCPQG